MVKLASARERRMYGPRLGWEYMNAGIYVLATILLTVGFAAEFWNWGAKWGMANLLIGFGIILMVNLHDLMAHLAAIDFCFALMRLDMQLALVEFAVPLLYVIGTILFFLATLFLFIQAEIKQELRLAMVIGGGVLWVVGSIHNSCQIYERADGHLQILQGAVLVPFLMASLLFLVHGLLMGEIWLGILGSFILFIGAVANVVKVFKMQQMRLEKLRGGAQERLNLQIMPGGGGEGEGEDETLMMEKEQDQDQDQHNISINLPPPTPYKDALLLT